MGRWVVVILWFFASRHTAGEDSDGRARCRLSRNDLGYHYTTMSTATMMMVVVVGMVMMIAFHRRRQTRRRRV